MKKIITALLLIAAVTASAQSNLVDVKALIARDYFRLGGYKIIGINNDGNLVSNSALEIPTVAAVRAYVGAFGGGTGGGGTLDSVRLVADTLYEYRSGIVAKTPISLYPCETDFGDVSGVWSDNSSLVTAFALKQNVIVHPNAAGYWFNGYKQWENKDSSVRASMVATYDSAKSTMMFSPRSNLFLFNKRMLNFDTTNYYGGVFTYNASSRGAKPTSDGSGVVFWVTSNDSSYFNGADNSIQFAIDKKNNGQRSRSWDGSAWTDWRVALDSATAYTSLLPLVGGGTIEQGYLGIKNRTAAPTVAASELKLHIDNSGSMRWWYSNGYYIRFDTTGMGLANLAIKLADITQAGNTFNGASQLLKMTASAKLPAVDASLITNINAIAGIAVGSGTALQSLRVNSGATALEWYTPGSSGTTVGNNILNLTNPAAITFIRINADNTVNSRTASQFRTDIGLTNIGERLATVADQNAISYLRVNADNSLSWRTAAQFLNDIGGDVATNIASGTLPAGRLPAHTGDVTSSAGSAALAIANSAVTQAKTANYSAYTLWGNNTNAAAAPSNITYQQTAKQTYSGTFTWDGTAPTGSPTTQYQWSQVGKVVTVNFWSTYTGTAGVTNTSLDLTWPGDLPIPEEPSGRTSNNDIVASGYAFVGTSTTNKASTARSVYIIRTGSGTYKFNLAFASTSAKVADFSISYCVP